MDSHIWIAMMMKACKILRHIITAALFAVKCRVVFELAPHRVWKKHKFSKHGIFRGGGWGGYTMYNLLAGLCDLQNNAEPFLFLLRAAAAAAEKLHSEKHAEKLHSGC